MKNIVIIGSESPLGKNLQNYIKSKYKNKFKLHLYSRKNNNFYFNKLTKFNKITKIEHLFFFASITPNKSEKFILKENLLGVLRFLSSIGKIKIDNFHFSSSISAFSSKNKYLNKESILNLDSEYGLSKYLTNILLKNYCKDNKIKLNILHCPTIIGKNYNKNFIGKLITKIIKKEKIVLYGSSSYYNSLCLDKQIFDFFFKKKNKLINESFIGSGIDLTFKDLYKFLQSMHINCELKKSKNNVPIVDLKNEANKITGVYSSKKIIEKFILDNL